MQIMTGQERFQYFKIMQTAIDRADYYKDE